MSNNGENPNGDELFVVAAPSGAGKTSLIRALLERCPNLALSVSDTTRAPRQGEVDGQHYHFIDVATFQKGVEEGRYLEHAEVFGNHYGTSREHVGELWRQGRDVLLEIDVQGAEQVRAAHTTACTIFILPPSMQTLAERLERRGLDSPEVIRRRLGEAQREIRACGMFDWLVVNDEFDRAASELAAIVTAWPLRRERQSHRINELLDETPSRITIKD